MKQIWFSKFQPGMIIYRGEVGIFWTEKSCRARERERERDAERTDLVPARGGTKSPQTMNLFSNYQENVSFGYWGFGLVYNLYTFTLTHSIIVRTFKWRPHLCDLLQVSGIITKMPSNSVDVKTVPHPTQITQSILSTFSR